MLHADSAFAYALKLINICNFVEQLEMLRDEFTLRGFVTYLHGTIHSGLRHSVIGADKVSSKFW